MNFTLEIQPVQDIFVTTVFDNRRFDSEAFFHFGSRLYIITKNRSDPFDGTAHIYSIPDSTGTYTARKELQFKTCENRSKCSV
ncbi:MAG: hypothetical protein WBV75_09370, partial [Robiginitalea sp.]